MTRPRNHSWGDPVRFERKTERTCTHEGCCIVKVTRHEGSEHWTEFYRGLDRIESRRRPPCEGELVKA